MWIDVFQSSYISIFSPVLTTNVRDLHYTIQTILYLFPSSLVGGSAMSYLSGRNSKPNHVLDLYSPALLWYLSEQSLTQTTHNWPFCLHKIFLLQLPCAITWIVLSLTCHKSWYSFSVSPQSLSDYSQDIQAQPSDFRFRNNSNQAPAWVEYQTRNHRYNPLEWVVEDIQEYQQSDLWMTMFPLYMFIYNTASLAKAPASCPGKLRSRLRSERASAVTLSTDHYHKDVWAFPMSSTGTCQLHPYHYEAHTRTHMCMWFMIQTCYRCDWPSGRVTRITGCNDKATEAVNLWWQVWKDSR